MNAALNLTVNQGPTWSNLAGGSWPTAGNWVSGAVASGTGTVADFASLDLSATATVTLDGARTVGGLKFGDLTPSHGWVLSTGTGGPLTLRLGTDWQDVGRYTRQNPSARTVFGAEVRETLGPWTGCVSLEGQWVHGLFMGNYSTDPLPDVFVLDLSARARLERDERDGLLEPYLMVRNLLDARYAYVMNYPMPGLNAMAGLRVTI